MSTLKKIWHNLLINPRHVIIGIFLISSGILLMSKDDYFFWPPVPIFLKWANDDVVGFLGILIGIGLIVYAMRRDSDSFLNGILLAFASGYLFMLSVFEFLHAVFANNFGMSVTFTAVFCLFLEVLALARNSDITKSDIKKEDKGVRRCCHNGHKYL